MPYPVTSFGYDPNSVGQQPGAGGWWNLGSAASSRPTGINYGPSSPSEAQAGGQISDIINQINRNAQTAANQARIPQAPALEAQSSQNIAGQLGGQLPADVTQQLAEAAAGAGVQSGSYGTPAGYLKALGLTSYDMTQAGQQNLSAAYARNPAAPIYDASGQLITPYQSAQLGLEGARIGGQPAGGGYSIAPSGRGAPAAFAPELGAGDVAYPSTAVDSGYVPSSAWQLAPQGAWWQSLGAYVDPTTGKANFPWSGGETADDVAASLGQYDLPAAPDYLSTSLATGAQPGEM